MIPAPDPPFERDEKGPQIDACGPPAQKHGEKNPQEWASLTTAMPEPVSERVPKLIRAMYYWVHSRW